MSEMTEPLPPTPEVTSRALDEQARKDRLRRQFNPIALAASASLTLIYLNYHFSHIPLLTPAILLACILWATRIQARAGGAFSIYPAAKKDRSVQFVVIAPGVVVGVFAFRFSAFVDLPDLCIASAIAGCGLTVFAMTIDRTLSSLSRVLTSILIFSCCYGYALAAATNADLEMRPPAIYPVWVVGKRQTTGRNTRDLLELAGTVPNFVPQEVEVDYRVFNATRPGGTVCIQLHTGGLGIRWFQVDLC